MADGIEVRIAPSAGTGGKRLAESPQSSFANDKFGGTQQRFAAPGVDARSEIQVEKKIAESQVALVAELKLLRAAMRSTAAGSPERQLIEARRNEIYQIQRANMASAFVGASDARGAAGSPQGQAGVAFQSSTRTGDVLRGIGSAGLGIGATGLGVAGAAWGGQSGVGIGLLGADLGMRAAAPIARGAWGLGKSAIGAAFGAGAGEAAGAAGAAGEAITAGTVAEAAPGVLAAIGGLPAIAVAITAALGIGAYAYIRNRDTVNSAVGGAVDAVTGLPKDLVALALARQYGAQEVPRQASAYRFGRSFQESGQSMIGASTGGRWSSLGINAADSTAMLGSSRELAGGDILSNTQAFRSLRMGVYAGLSNDQNVAATGGFARLGADSEESIRIIAEGTMRGGQSGLQGEVGRATLDFLRTQSQRTVIQNPTAAVAGISALASMFQASGIPALRGAGAIDAIRGIGAAFDSSSLLDEGKIGQSITMVGQAKLLAAMQTTKHITGYTDAQVAKMSSSQRMTEGLRTLDRGFANTGPSAAMFLKDAVATTLQAAKADPLMLDSIEKAWGLARGPATDQMLTDKMLPEAMTGNYTAFDADLAQVKLKTSTSTIAPGARGEARLSHTEAATGERVMSTYVKTLDDVETKSLTILDAYLKGGTTPTKRLAEPPASTSTWGTAIGGAFGAFTGATPSGPGTWGAAVGGATGALAGEAA